MHWRLIPLCFFSLFWPYTLEAPMCVELYFCIACWPFAPFGLEPASLGLVFKPTFDHDICKINLAYLWLLQLDIPWSVEGTYLWVSLTSFHLTALSIGTFLPQELDHLFHRHSFFPLYHSILLLFFWLNRKRQKKIKYSKKRAGTGTLFPFIVGS